MKLRVLEEIEEKRKAYEQAVTDALWAAAPALLRAIRAAAEYREAEKAVANFALDSAERAGAVASRWTKCQILDAALAELDGKEEK